MGVTERRIWQGLLMVTLLCLGIGATWAQRRDRRPARPSNSVNAEINQLKKRMAELERRAFKRQGNVWVAEFNGARVEFRPGGDVTLKGRNIKVAASGRLKATAGTASEIKASGVLKLNGLMVQLNNGSRPVSRQGDVTSGGPPPNTLVTGSDTVRVP